MNFVEGSYKKAVAALEAVNYLKDEGYQAKDIQLISNRVRHDTLMEEANVQLSSKKAYDERKVNDSLKNDLTLWEKIKVLFTIDEDYRRDSTDPKDDPLSNYRNDIEKGNIIIVVEGERKDS